MSEENGEVKDVVVIPEQPKSVMPVFSGKEMAEAMIAYKDLQKELDKSMPDQIMKIGKGENAQMFRKKGYWRAIKTAFNLQVREVQEQRVELGEDWGYEVIYEAIAGNGASSTGDGACFKSEKVVYKKDWAEWQKNGKRGRVPYIYDSNGEKVIDLESTAKNATIHNVRSHAHTRAFNRAVSNLVGFGEVSAEEVERQYTPEKEEKPKPKPKAKSKKKKPNVKEFNKIKKEYEKYEDAEPIKRIAYKINPDAASADELGHKQMDELIKQMKDYVSLKEKEKAFGGNDDSDEDGPDDAAADKLYFLEMKLYKLIDEYNKVRSDDDPSPMDLATAIDKDITQIDDLKLSELEILEEAIKGEMTDIKKGSMFE